MILKAWDDLPENMKTPEVREYYDILTRKRAALFFKRCFDFAVSSLMLALFSPMFAIMAAAIKIDSDGPVFYRQKRVTRYGKRFRIFKFRTMAADADRSGCLVTLKNDPRVTRVGKIIRKVRLDETGQLIDIWRGAMTFVGTRPEVPKYVEKYTPEMMATLLLPAGVTSEASILYKDEDELLAGSEDAEKTYIEEILPAKMKHNLKAIREFGLRSDIKVIFMTLSAVLDRKHTKGCPEAKEK